MGTNPSESAKVDAFPFGVEARPVSIADAIHAHAADRPNAPAVVGQGGLAIDYATLASFLNHAHAALESLSCGPSTRVGLIVPPGHLGILMTVAVASRAQLVPLNPALTVAELKAEANRFALDAIIAPDWLDGLSFADLGAVGPVILRASLSRDLKLVLATDAPDRLTARPGVVTAASVALLLRSSGTTGEPKQIPVTHGNLFAMAKKMQGWFDLLSSDRIPCTLPLYYAAGLKTTIFVPLILGGSIGSPDPHLTYNVGHWIEEIAPTVLSVSSASLRGVLDRFRAASQRPVTPSLRFIICGAAYLPDSLRQEAEDLLGVPVLEYYGLSEAGAMAANPAPPRRRKPGTVGLIPPGELMLVKEDGSPALTGEVGEITVTGPSVTPGYVTALRRTPSGVETGWLSTGDLGRIDEDGYLTIVGRSKEIINRGGEKVSPYEVEKALLRHPAVLDAGVFGVPHPRLGENVAAAVVLRPGAEATADTIRASLNEQLVRFKIPQSLTIVESLPRGGTGKLMRSELVSQYLRRVRQDSARPDRMLEHQIMAVWSRLLKRSDFGIDDDFFELGGDSLLAAEMLVDVEAIARRPVAQSQLSVNLTIRTLTDAVCSDLGQTRELLTQVRAGEGAPLYFCHGDYTTRGLFALRLFDMVETKRPIYLLHFYQDLHHPDLTIEQIAESYADEIRKVQQSGPVVISGYCNGGLVAWELTRRLRAANYPVEALLLIETPSLNARPIFRFMHRVITTLGQVLPGRAGEIMRQEAMRSFWHRMRGHGSFGSLVVHVAKRAIRRLLRGRSKRPKHAVGAAPSPHWLYQRTLSRYAPPRLDVPLFCYVARDGRRTDIEPKYWRKLSPKVSVDLLPGAHHSIVTAEAPELARAYQRTLDALP